MKSLVWFRSDLRMDDNPALRNACIESDEVHGIYLYSKKQLKLHNEANCKTEFIIENLKVLSKSLININIPLTIINVDSFQNCERELLNICNERSLSKIYFNNQFGEDEQERDKSVIECFKKNNLDISAFDDQVVYKPGFIKTGEGKPYSVFTPFKRRWIENFNMDLLDIDFSYTQKVKTQIIPNVDNFEFDFKKQNIVNMELWPAGEEQAMIILNNYLKEKIFRYSIDRNDPIIDGTSRLSPYLASGIISPKRCILEALKINNFELDSGEKGITKWIDEIVWREFYKNIMYSFPRVSKGKPFQEYTNKIQWRFDEVEFAAWQDGNTGFPLIDSAMRQLKHEGWMHNRLRMVTAMFFTKNLLHDWRLGEKYFMENLMDGDFSSNNGGWQWSSSTGTDAAPYFRIFNPLTQSKNFDPKGLFIKKYVDEIKDLSSKDIHDPSDHQRNSCNYPMQICDLKQSRLRAIEAFNKAKN